MSYLDKKKQISSKFVKNRRPCLVGLCVIIIFLKTDYSLAPVVFNLKKNFFLLTFQFLVSLKFTLHGDKKKTVLACALFGCHLAIAKRQLTFFRALAIVQ